MSRAHALRLRDAALRAADPEAAVAAHVSYERRGALWIGDTPVDIETTRRVVVLGAGKACVAMARGLAPALVGSPARVSGELTAPAPAASPIPGVTVRAASHPLPDARSVAAAESALALASACGRGDLVIALISGGGSALWCAPPEGTSLDTIRARHGALLASGQDVAKMNAARARDSRIKAGRLARAAYPARVVTLLMSDVAGAPTFAVASGPTLPWPGGLPGAADPPPPADHPCFVDHGPAVVTAADGLVAARAAAREASALGYDVDLVEEPTTAHWRDALAQLSAPLEPGGARIMWGEARVPLPPNPGRGGRCQHLALAALGGLAPGETVACLSTDGVDGEGASGAVVTHEMRAGVGATEASEALARAGAHATLARLGALLEAHPTGTNVNDLYVRLRHRRSANE